MSWTRNFISFLETMMHCNKEVSTVRDKHTNKFKQFIMDGDKTHNIPWQCGADTRKNCSQNSQKSIPERHLTTQHSGGTATCNFITDFAVAFKNLSKHGRAG